MCACHGICMEAKEKPMDFVLTLHCVGHRDHTWVIGLNKKCISLLHHCTGLTRCVLHRSCAGNHSFCELLSAQALSHPEDSISQHSSVSSHSYILSGHSSMSPARECDMNALIGVSLPQRQITEDHADVS